MPNIFTINTLLKAVVASRPGSLAQVDALLSQVRNMDSGELKLDSHSYFQLLLACKKEVLPERAIQVFDELLANGVEPIQLLCNVLTQTIGHAEFNAYHTSRLELFEACRKQRGNDRGGSSKGGSRGGRGGKSSGGGRRGYESGGMAQWVPPQQQLIQQQLPVPPLEKLEELEEGQMPAQHDFGGYYSTQPPMQQQPLHAAPAGWHHVPGQQYPMHQQQQPGYEGCCYPGGYAKGDEHDGVYPAGGQPCNWVQQQAPQTMAAQEHAEGVSYDEYAGESYDELYGEAQEEVYTYDVDEERTENNDDRRSISIDSDYQPCY